MVSVLRMQVCFDIALLHVTLSFHILPTLVLVKWSRRTKCQKKLGGRRALGMFGKNKSEFGVLEERRAGTLRV